MVKTITALFFLLTALSCAKSVESEFTGESVTQQRQYGARLLLNLHLYMTRYQYLDSLRKNEEIESRSPLDSTKYFKFRFYNSTGDLEATMTAEIHANIENDSLKNVWLTLERFENLNPLSRGQGGVIGSENIPRIDKLYLEKYGKQSKTYSKTNKMEAFGPIPAGTETYQVRYWNLPDFNLYIETSTWIEKGTKKKIVVGYSISYFDPRVMTMFSIMFDPNSDFNKSDSTKKNRLKKAI